jgi:hypothetical protein
MTRNDRMALTVVGVAIGVLLALLGIWMAWAFWGWLLGVAVSGAVLALVYQSLTRQHDQGRGAAPRFVEPPRPQPVWEQRRLEGVALPSATRDYLLTFSATVRWQATSSGAVRRMPPESLPSLALDAIVSRAREFVGTIEPRAVGLAQTSLAAALGAVLPDSSNQVMAWAEDVTLELAAEDAEFLTEMARLRKKQEVWENERALERGVRRYLAEDALASTENAVVWWLARNIDEVDQAVARLGVLAQLSAAARGVEVEQRYRHVAPEEFRRAAASTPGVAHGGDGAAQSPWGVNGTPPDPVREFVDLAFPDTSDPHRAMFGHLVAETLTKLGRPELAPRIRQVSGASPRPAGADVGHAPGDPDTAAGALDKTE